MFAFSDGPNFRIKRFSLTRSSEPELRKVKIIKSSGATECLLYHCDKIIAWKELTRFYK